jgi:dTDP-4-dehydrorhamnose reductase
MDRVLLLGGSGILGSEVLYQLKARGIDYLAPQSTGLDIRDKVSLENFVLAFKPNWIVNCVAWTNVDGAEVQFESALELNEFAVRNIAEVAKKVKSRVIHISTDYVFDGDSAIPYDEKALASPINNYGKSKLRGEKTLMEVLPTDSYIVRTSWLYGVNGKNFVKSIATKAVGNETARVVDDQIGSPTNARDLAAGIISITERLPVAGIYNFSNLGSCSWFKLAKSIYKGLDSDPKLVEAINSSNLSLIAKRPKYSLLSKEKWQESGLIDIPEWEWSLKSILPEIIHEIQNSER